MKDTVDLDLVHEYIRVFLASYFLHRARASEISPERVHDLLREEGIKQIVRCLRMQHIFQSSLSSKERQVTLTLVRNVLESEENAYPAFGGAPVKEEGQKPAMRKGRPYHGTTTGGKVGHGPNCYGPMFSGGVREIHSP